MNQKKTHFRTYLEKIADVFRAGDAREESFYPALADLIQETAQASGRPEIQVTIQPRPTEAGNPDFRVWDGASQIVGYIEAKPPTAELLDQFEDSAQLQRYRGTFPNLILTNFLEFRLYRDGQRVAIAKLGHQVILTKLQKIPPLAHEEEAWTLLDRFLGFTQPRLLTAEYLAVELAKRTRFLREVVKEELDKEQKTGSGQLLGFYEAFQKFLIGSLTTDDFADLYAQTVTYGLFAARTRAADGFSRLAAFHHIPPTIGILRDLFRFISLGEPPEEMAWIVDDIVQVLAGADVSEMMSQYYKEGKGDDPIVHFYETFLAHYDPEERERRGVYYTPDPVVSYIVRSLDLLLKGRFGHADGLASEGVTLLDPAAGTMTFVARAVEQAVREFAGKYGTGGREAFIRKHILGNFYAFELMMAPYAVGHLKMAFFLDELGHRLQGNERVPFYLTNTLDMNELEASQLPGLSSLAEESHLAGRVKQKQPILVILGNPPYSGHSANKGEWILRQIETYKQVDGKPLGEKNPKWLQDDYVKFLRFAQWKIEQAGRGVVGMITNHGYLDNPTFRGMRRSLMQTFDEIYLLDLHGNALKRERCPDGSPDENVFDIRQGVAIALLVKTGKQTEKSVRHAELWGTREDKYQWLKENDVIATPWAEIYPRPGFYLFVPRDEAELERYNAFPRVTDIFEKYSVGIVTARDSLTIHRAPQQVWTTALNFSQLEPELARQAYGLGKDARDWKVTLAQQDLRDSGPDWDKVVPILYRPFDVRYTYYTGRSRGFLCMPRPEVMRHMLAGENLALVTPRRMEYVGEWQHVFISKAVSEHVAVSLKTIDYHFPLYLYPQARQVDLFSALEPQQRQPNLHPQLLAALANAFGGPPAPEQIFYYIYAVLYAPAYREKYAHFLRSDFPRVPFTRDAALFDELATLGKKLADLHLLNSLDLDPPACRFEGTEDNRVVKVVYDTSKEQISINPAQVFAPVPPAVWEYTIGGYQVCEKWLKDRRGQSLTLDEIRTYCRIVTALAHTIEIQEQIDGMYPRLEQTLLSLKI
ncbi:MAG: N-6 DNA methylase [Anaerolineae bacterium]|nr:N-6 DNA methylase [Anaerolineae bacterium]